jgi:photosystem II stability/assembly factor-like uncharacterized protein
MWRRAIAPADEERSGERRGEQDAVGRPPSQGETTVKRAPFMLIVVCALTAAFAAAAADAAFASSAGWTAHRAASAPLLSVAAADAAHAWAVGPGPTIVTTSNGGASWTSQSPATADDLYAVAFSDATEGWAVGPGGTVVATTDGGVDWAVQTTPTTNATLIGAASRGQDCWAVGVDDTSGQGVILATTDGGTTWVQQSSPSSNALFSVTFTDANHGWAVGDHGTILVTNGGGTTWTAQSSPTTGYLNGVTAVDALHAWAVGEKGVIIATSDGGAHWVVRRAAGKKAPDLYTVACAGKRHAWAVGVGGVILASTNGGVTWRAQHSPTRQDLASVAFAGALHGFVAGTAGTMLTTTHAGWSDVRPPLAVAAGAAGWHKRAVRVVLSATDRRGGSGIASIQYSLDLGKTWTRGSSFTVAAPADHGNDGAHTFLYRATDNAGNVEAARSGRVSIDTRRPVPNAPWAGVAVSGELAALRCAVGDPRPGSATATVAITIRTAAGRPVKILRFTGQPVGTALTCRFLCTLPVGRYRFSVSATDAAGNRGSTIATNRLAVRDRPIGFA